MGKLAYIFPGQGQGSVKVGMGRDAWEHSSQARRIFFEANRFFGISLSDLCFFGPEENLLKTNNAQPASLLINLAYAAALSELERNGEEIEFIPRGVSPDFLAGHSVGYLAALVYARVLTLRQGFEIVRERAKLMTGACQINPGKMIVLIDPKIPEIEALLNARKYKIEGARTWIANYNSNSQIVLSGPNPIIDQAAEEITQKGLARRSMPLNTEGAFHSDCMAPAIEPFEKFLESIPFSDPAIPIIGNSRAQIITTAKEAKREGVATFIEMGHGEVLSNNLKRSAIGAGVAIVAISAALAAYLLKRSKEKEP